jgi:hypothetical protein
MVIRTLKAKRVWMAASAILLCAAFAAPTQAGWTRFSRRQARLASCGPEKTLVRVDTKVCQPNRNRPAFAVYRACCANRRGNVHCKKYPECPRRSLE